MDGLIATFRRDVRDDYTVVPTGASMFDHAADLCRVHPLRAYDAVQLACALTIHNSAVAAGRQPPIFICADRDLLDVAAREGLSVENPLAHP